MGIAKGAYSLLCELKRDFPQLMKGKVLQLGRQHTFLRLNKLRQISRQFGLDTQGNYFVQLPESAEVSVSDITLFQSLGFDSVESMDYSNYESPTHVHDFNLPVPEELHEQYDAIFDGGTLEHIFNFSESLKNIHRLLKTGGIVIHASPSSNRVDHGFYMFSPTVFYDYYLANGFEIIKSYIFEYERRHDKAPWLIYDYTPGRIQHLSFGGWGDGKLLGIWFVARKLENSSCDVTPQQSYYLKAWSCDKDNQFDDSDSGSNSSDSDSLVSRVKTLIKSNQFLYSSLVSVLVNIRKFIPLGKPAVIARY